jgi:hypothetical protein
MLLVLAVPLERRAAVNVSSLPLVLPLDYKRTTHPAVQRVCPTDGEQRVGGRGAGRDSRRGKPLLSSSWSSSGMLAKKICRARPFCHERCDASPARPGFATTGTSARYFFAAQDPAVGRATPPSLRRRPAEDTERETERERESVIGACPEQASRVGLALLQQRAAVPAPGRRPCSNGESVKQKGASTGKHRREPPNHLDPDARKGRRAASPGPPSRRARDPRRPCPMGRACRTARRERREAAFGPVRPGHDASPSRATGGLGRAQQPGETD